METVQAVTTATVSWSKIVKWQVFAFITVSLLFFLMNKSLVVIVGRQPLASTFAFALAYVFSFSIAAMTSIRFTSAGFLTVASAVAIALGLVGSTFWVILPAGLAAGLAIFLLSYLIDEVAGGRKKAGWLFYASVMVFLVLILIFLH